jgi:DNA-binding transcriptional MocR family regulator
VTEWRTHYARRVARMEAAEVRDLLSLLGRRDVISFAGGIPDPALFPTEAIRAAYDRILGDPARAAAALQYSVPEGDPKLRAWIAEDMGRRGVACTAANVLVTSGSQQALDFLGKLFVSPDETILIGRPTFLGALQAFNAYEPRYGELPGPGNGRGAEGYAIEGPDKPKFGYVMPEFENPTGLTLTREDRLRLLDFADARDIPLVEDSPYETLRYAGEPSPPLLALAAERAGGIDGCRVIYLGTFSKSIAPAFRIGWMVGPREVIAQLALIKQASDIQVSTINQMVMHEVAPAIVQSQAARVQPVYRARRDAMLRALRAHMPQEVAWTEPEGGFFVWVTLPPHIDAAELLRRAVADAKVAFVPGAAFFPDRSGQNTLRLSFSLNDEATTERGVARLAEIVRHAVAGRGRDAA